MKRTGNPAHLHQCRKCHSLLPESSFYVQGKLRDSLSPQCKQCSREKAKRTNNRVSGVKAIVRTVGKRAGRDVLARVVDEAVLRTLACYPVSSFQASADKILDIIDRGVCQLTGTDFYLEGDPATHSRAPRLLNTDCGIWSDSNTMVVCGWVVSAYSALEATSVDDFKKQLLAIAGTNNEGDSSCALS